jgi:SAM-dependent methyltransferase
MEALRTVLYVNHKEAHCGVFQYGARVYDAIKQSAVFNFVYAECTNRSELVNGVKLHRPVAIIYNYYPSTMPWLGAAIHDALPMPQLGTMHEVTQQRVDTADTVLFDFHIAPDPTLLITNPIVFKTGRLIPMCTTHLPQPRTTTIGSFGFGTNGKGFTRIIEQVQQEFETAVIRLNIPFAAFGDSDGSGARAYAEHCRKLVTQSGIDLRITYDFMEPDDLLGFLEGNTINAIFYEENAGRGIASAIDWALAVNRPIAITKSNMFRHVSNADPSICIEDSSLKEIIKRGMAPLMEYKKEWTAENLCWDYERIVSAALANFAPASVVDNLTDRLKLPARKLIVRLRSRTGQSINKDKLMLASVPKSSDRRRVVEVVDKSALLFVETVFNRILDDAAREQYQRVISLLFELCPDEMSRKIAEANIQQAFVFETVRHLSATMERPKILSVGCYEDTAFGGLRKMGFDVEGIDPLLNYDLSTFITKPGVGRRKYDLVFSTSVIEHVNDDERFVREMSELVKPGGFIILTCDYKQDYRRGDRVPAVDFRFYTRHDLERRLLANMPGCGLYGPANWDCPIPDFWFDNLNYTFATFVAQKQLETPGV